MSLPIDVMFDAAQKHKLNWDDEDLLSITCTYLEMAFQNGKIPQADFEEFVASTAKDDVEAIKEAEM